MLFFPLQTTFPHLFSVLYLSDTKLWDKFAKSSHCEQELPSSVASKISIFQQLLLVQALRPDRLYSASALFASRALGTLLSSFLFISVQFSCSYLLLFFLFWLHSLMLFYYYLLAHRLLKSES